MSENKVINLVEKKKEKASSNVVSLDAFREKRKRQDRILKQSGKNMSFSEFQDKYMKNSVVSLFGKDNAGIRFANGKEEDIPDGIA